MEKYLQAVNNYFEAFYTEGNFTIADGVITVGSSGFVKGQYVRIMGSLLNDTVVKIAGVTNGVLSFDEKLEDETFNGVLVGLRIPKVFIDLTKDIDAWIAKMGVKTIRSESIPNYSVTFKDADFIQEFGARLAPFRKMPPQSVYGFMRHIQKI